MNRRNFFQCCIPQSSHIWDLVIFVLCYENFNTSISTNIYILRTDVTHIDEYSTHVVYIIARLLFLRVFILQTLATVISYSLPFYSTCVSVLELCKRIGKTMTLAFAGSTTVFARLFTLKGYLTICIHTTTLLSTYCFLNTFI